MQYCQSQSKKSQDLVNTKGKYVISLVQKLHITYNQYRCMTAGCRSVPAIGQHSGLSMADWSAAGRLHWGVTYV